MNVYVYIYVYIHITYGELFFAFIWDINLNPFCKVLLEKWFLGSAIEKRKGDQCGEQRFGSGCFLGSGYGFGEGSDPDGKPKSYYDQQPSVCLNVS